MSTSASRAPEPVLFLVPAAGGAEGAAGGIARAADSPGGTGETPQPPYVQADPSAAQLLVTDLAATRGDGIFETVGVFDGVAVNLRPHLERLARSARMLELPEPDLEVMADAFAAAVDAAMADPAVAAHPAVPDLTVRIIVTRGVEGTGVPTCWIHAKQADDYSAAQQGIRVDTLDRGIPTTAPETSPWLLAGAKSLSYAINMAATREAHRRGVDDVLFVASDGYCLEGPTSTLLIRKDGEYLTTPVDAGVLPGTSLGSIAVFVRGEGGVLREQLLTVADVAAADAAWLLSSVRLAAPITHLDGKELPVDRETTERFQLVLRGKA
ncbi:aminotransferase class IV [Brachybacterium sp. DNPG3]